MESIFSAWLIWFLIGIGLAFLELFIPAFVVIFMGLGCLIVSGTLLIWPLTFTHQVVLFIVATILSIVFLRKWFMKIFQGTSLVRKEQHFDDFPKGSFVKVIESISPKKTGRILHRGTLWDARSDEDIDKGDTVEIISFTKDSRQVFFVKKITNKEMS
jgi:inner membrane protein